ncbi:SDR family NAD(P)-dependent oxidoreductase [Pseudoduganella sp. FT26W]|uniref:SDR family NAD(P)-dependent oxidoreductase n=1 Tax=Duganella aquatilis TaxID=2666082 RepID=A0A844D9B1_9BURK|nr:SDR family oxidoreductase [Duganella aquatilis]MRW84180.1 SDR family NAD(P)-dependent oxidoreductase [Duganella aquatilis]
MTHVPKQKIAFITGGNRGIGFETARQLGQAGALPVIGARSEQAGREAVEQLRADGIAAQWLLFDVTRYADHQRAYDHFHALAGRLDILVNNAGVYLEGETGVKDLYNAADVPEAVLRQTMEANFFAPVLLTQTLLPLLQRSAAGRIVNLSSILASLTLHRDPSSPIYSANSVAYDTSKTALNGYTVHLAKALAGTPVKANAAHPGWVQTSMGGSAAPMAVADGARTSVQLALLPDDGPSGGFFHLGEVLPW